MRSSPTDLQILEVIYSRYYESFSAYSNQHKNRTTKNFAPIDTQEIVRDLRIDGDIIFAMLCHHLNQKNNATSMRSPDLIHSDLIHSYFGVNYDANYDADYDLIAILCEM